MKSKPTFIVRRAKRRLEHSDAAPWLVCDLGTLWSQEYPSRAEARAAARSLNINVLKKCVPSRS